jgi:cytidylate kinase
MSRLPVVAIDGPAGSGKSTVAKALAKRLQFVHVDTGALYRGVAWLAISKGVELGVEKEVVATSRGVRFEFHAKEDGNHLYIDGEDVANYIRTEEVSAAASKVSAFPGVRALLLDLQRELGRNGAVVLEGRDIGTVVFPNAELKFFLFASPEERALRRHEELRAKGIESDLAMVAQDLAKRDHQDSTRPIAPLKQAVDAIPVDTSGKSVEAVLDQLENLVRKHMASVAR